MQHQPHEHSLEQAFLKHIALHQALIYKVCHTFERAEEARRDLFQDILVQLWRAFPNYNGSCKWTTWAYRIALNVAITQRRKSKMSITGLTDQLQQEIDRTRPAGSYDTTADEQAEALHRAIAQLTAAEKALILLYLDDVSYKEISDITGMTENNVGVKLNRIKSKLKTLLSYGK